MQSAGIDCYVGGSMDKLDHNTKAGKHEAGAADLAQRLARYRRRVEAEGRQRSLRVIDRAIEAAGGGACQSLGITPKETS
jgi:hypothetical protein